MCCVLRGCSRALALWAGYASALALLSVLRGLWSPGGSTDVDVEWPGRGESGAERVGAASWHLCRVGLGLL